MEVKTVAIQLFLAVGILGLLAIPRGDHADLSPFFAKHKWRLRDAYYVVCAPIVLIIFAGVVYPLLVRFDLIFSLRDTTTMTPDDVLRLWGWSLLYILWSYFFMIVHPYGARSVDFGILRPRCFGNGLLALNMAFGYSSLCAADASIPRWNSFITAAGASDPLLFATVFGFGVPICEELVFRGVAFAPVARRAGKWAAIVGLALVESLIHPEFASLERSVLFVVFVAFYLIYIRTESLWGPVILHIGINLPLWQPYVIATAARDLQASTLKFLFIGTPLLALLILDVWWLVKFLSGRKPDLS